MLNAWAGVIYATGMEYNQPLNVSTLRVTKSGIKPDEIMIELLEDNSRSKGYVRVAPELAIPLAKAILVVAEGYASKAELQVA